MGRTVQRKEGKLKNGEGEVKEERGKGKKGLGEGGCRAPWRFILSVRWYVHPCHKQRYGEEKRVHSCWICERMFTYTHLLTDLIL